eukprot:sb/3477497/
MFSEYDTVSTEVDPLEKLTLPVMVDRLIIGVISEPEFTRKFLTVSGLFTSSEKLLDSLLKMFAVHNGPPTPASTKSSTKSGTDKHKGWGFVAIEQTDHHHDCTIEKY